MRDWHPGDNVRATESREIVGGKGNNVARALTRLGHLARPVTFLGGSTGDRCRALFVAERVHDPIVIPTAAPTREIVTVRSPASPATAFFDADPAITAEEVDALLTRVGDELEHGSVEALTLSGSSPTNTTHHVYSELVSLAAARRVPVFLDTYGPPLAAIWGFWPETLSLNRREAGLLLRNDNPSDSEILHLLTGWSRRGVSVAVVTDGPKDLLARINGQNYRITPPEIEAVNPIGSGDCLLAGLVSARLNGLDPEATLRRAVASATANALVWDAGAIDPGEVDRLEPEVEIAVE